MTHFAILVIVPKAIWIQGAEAVREYIAQILDPYLESTLVTPYVVATKGQLEIEYEKEKKKKMPKNLKRKKLKKFAKSQWGEIELDKQQNVISRRNPYSLFDFYSIGSDRMSPVKRNDDVKEELFPKESDLKGFSILAETLYKEYLENKEDNVISTVFDRDAKLHKRRDIGWLCTFKELIKPEQWDEEFTKILKDAADQGDCAVYVGAHV